MNIHKTSKTAYVKSRDERKKKKIKQWRESIGRKKTLLFRSSKIRHCRGWLGEG